MLMPNAILVRIRLQFGILNVTYLFTKLYICNLVKKNNLVFYQMDLSFGKKT